MNKDETQKPDPNDVRTEYAALIDFHNSVVTHRFTLLGFYLAAIALIAKDGAGFLEACLILGLTISMYMMELRNRSLYTQIGRRAMYIEINYWKLNRKNESDTGLPFFCSMRPEDCQDIVDKLPQKQKEDLKWKPKFWHKHKIFLPDNHSKGLDFLYASMAIYAILKMF